MVGCVIASRDRVLATGWHRRFGGPHAEIHALQEFSQRDQASVDATEATLYVSLEPCCHHGKTPPCTDAILASGIRRVVVAVADPHAEVAGQGIARLRAAGLTVEIGVAEGSAAAVLAPYAKLLGSGHPWVTAKWAMTLDGKIATHRGDSRWISSEAAREVVHQMRGRMDGIVIGIGTALADDPLLTARPAGPRVATRIVVDSDARLPLESRLVQTTDQAPVLLAHGPGADPTQLQLLADAGVELLHCQRSRSSERLMELLDALGQRKMTNVLVEGGSRLLGSLADLGAIDEVHAFIAPKLLGGTDAPSAWAGAGIPTMSDALHLQDVVIQQIDGDVYVRGRVAKEH